MVVKTFWASCFLNNGLKSQQGTIQRFWNKIKFEGLTIDFKGNKWLLWSRCLELDKRKRPEVWKNPPGREHWKLHVNYLRAQVNFRQLGAETAGNRYLRRFLPASAGILTCGSVYLRPSQVILHAPVLQCKVQNNRVEFCCSEESYSMHSVSHITKEADNYLCADHQGRCLEKGCKKLTNLQVPQSVTCFNAGTTWASFFVKHVNHLHHLEVEVTDTFFYTGPSLARYRGSRACCFLVSNFFPGFCQP